MLGTQFVAYMGMQVVDGVLIVQAPEDFSDESLGAVKSRVLNKVHSSSVRGVLVDVSPLKMLDSVSYNLLAEMARTVTLLGAKVIFAGLQPGVVSTLIDLNVDCDDILTAVDVDAALAQLRPALPEPEPDIDPEEEVEIKVQDEDTESCFDGTDSEPDNCNLKESARNEDE